MDHQITIPERDIRYAFKVGLILKGLNALLEIIGGFLFLSTGTITAIVNGLIQNELIEDPHDFIARHLEHLLPHFSGRAQIFGAIYLFAHGFIKIFLIANLLRGRLWAYPATMYVLGLFVVYQMYRFFAYSHSVFLLLLSAFDVLLIALTWHEWKVVRNHPLADPKI